MKLLTKKNSTKPERIFYEILKELRIPFKHRWIINGREIDFVIKDKVCIEIDGHNQDYSKNEMLVKLGYTPVHIKNKDLYSRKSLIKEWLQIYMT